MTTTTKRCRDCGAEHHPGPHVECFECGDYGDGISGCACGADGPVAGPDPRRCHRCKRTEEQGAYAIQPRESDGKLECVDCWQHRENVAHVRRA